MGNHHSSGRQFSAKRRISKKTRSSLPTESLESSSQDVDIHADLAIVAQKWNQLSRSLAEAEIDGDEESVGPNISSAAMEHWFHETVPFLGTLIFQYFRSHSDAVNLLDDPQLISQRAFISCTRKVLKYQSDEQQVDFFFDVFSKGASELTDEDFELLLTVCVKVACKTTGLSKLINDADQQVFDALTRSLDADSQGGFDKNQFNFWVRQNGLHLLNCLYRFVSQTLISCSGLPNDTVMSSPSEDDLLPILDEENQKTLQLNSMALLWLLSCALPSCYVKKSSRSMDMLPSSCRGLPTVSSNFSPLPSPSSPDPSRNMASSTWPAINAQQFIQQLVNASSLTTWTLLYNSEKHGLCMNRFLHHTLHYSGPTVSLYKLESGSVFCVAVDTEWRESSQRWGGSDCVIYQLQPQFKRLECGSNLVYLNEHSRGCDHGIEFGTDPKRPILKVASNMHDAKLQGGLQDKMECVEVWGCAGSGPKVAQQQHIRWENRQAEKIQKITRPTRWQESTDRYLIDMVRSNKYADN